MRKILEHWLYLVAIGHILAGLALPLLAYSSAFDFYAELIRGAFWPGTQVPPEADSFQRWIVALFGPTVTSWGILMLYLVRAGIRSKEVWPWNALIVAVIAWAPADITISLLHEFWLHVVVDIIAVIAITVPACLLRTQRIA